MKDPGYWIDVVNHNERDWKRPDGAKGLVRVGVPPTVAARWQRVRRTMTPKALVRKLQSQRN
jgi:hypothetical protein